MSAASNEFPADLVELCRDEACKASGGYSPSSVEIVAVLRASKHAELVTALEEIALRHEEFPEKRDGYGSMAVMIARATLAALKAAGEK